MRYYLGVLWIQTLYVKETYIIYCNISFYLSIGLENHLYNLFLLLYALLFRSILDTDVVYYRKNILH